MKQTKANTMKSNTKISGSSPPARSRSSFFLVLLVSLCSSTNLQQVLRLMSENDWFLSENDRFWSHFCILILYCLSTCTLYSSATLQQFSKKNSEVWFDQINFLTSWRKVQLNTLLRLARENFDFCHLEKKFYKIYRIWIWSQLWFLAPGEEVCLPLRARSRQTHNLTFKINFLEKQKNSHIISILK